jgi:transcriptional regulator CtsR
MDTSKIIDDYLQQLNSNEKKALDIAKSHLESSFCLEKSNEFLKFKEEYLQSKSTPN